MSAWEPGWPYGWWGFAVFGVLNAVRIYKPWTWRRR